MVSVPHAPTNVVASSGDDRIQFSEDVYTVDWWMPAHQHRNSHLVLCLAGEIEHHSGKKSLLVAEKSVAYVPAHETHSDLFRGTVHTFQITLNEERFGIAQGASRSESFHRLHKSVSLMQLLYREFKSPDKYSPLMFQSLTMELLVSIHRQEAASCTKSCRAPWLMQVRELLHEEFSENLQLESIAAKVGVHPAHLTKAFRKKFGQSIGEYVRGLRIARAQHLLESSDMSIGAIALATGFVDQSHFTRTFKKFLGRTPNSYRGLN